MNEEAKKLEELLQKRTAQLEEMERELEGLAFSISHDLRAPLRAIIGFADLLREEHADNLPPEGKRYLDILYNQAQRLSDMVGSVLWYSRVGRKEMNFTFVDMNGLVAESFAAACTQEQDRTIDLRLGNLPTAWGDRELLEVVWKNLLSNAVKFTRPKANRTVEVGGGRQGTDVVYMVRDNGVGFDPKYAERLFGLFQRLHPEGSFEGVGAGLAIARRIVNRHGGRIWAEAEPDKGATFHFSLPVPSEVS